MDYAAIEAEALDVVRMKVPRVTAWVRGWTNEARRAIQRTSNYAWMANFYPLEGNPTTAEVPGIGVQDPPAAVLSTPWRALEGQRIVSAPAGFKEIYSERDGLWRIAADGKLTAIPEVRFEDVAATVQKKRAYDAEQNAYVLAEQTGEPLCFVRVQDADGAAFRLYPVPAADTDLLLHAYFYLPDIGDVTTGGDPAAGYIDAIIREFDPLVVRDALCREAFIALQQYDTAAKHEALRTGRHERAARGERSRELPDGLVFRYSFNAQSEEPTPDDGYRRNRGPFR